MTKVETPVVMTGVFVYTDSMKIKIDPADKAFSLYIRTRDDWQCQRCMKQFTPPTSGLHCSHFMGRGKEGTRFDPENADALCYGCHMYFTAHPAEHYMWQVEKKTKQTVDLLVLRSNTYKKKDRKMERLVWNEALQDLIKQRARASM